MINVHFMFFLEHVGLCEIGSIYATPLYRFKVIYWLRGDLKLLQLRF